MNELSSRALSVNQHPRPLSLDTCHVPGNQLGPSLLFRDGETEAQAVQSQFDSRFVTRICPHLSRLHPCSAGLGWG